MKNTRYNEATNMETVLINHQNDYIAYDGKIKLVISGWIG